MTKLALLLAAIVAAAGCYVYSATPAQPVPTTVSITPFGVSMNSPSCSGRVTLSNGLATVSDPCFTDNTNVVVCTDATAPNTVSCSPGRGELTISGTGSDVISYARVR
jgi:hypothetical protein